ncbi:MAG: hypothetical protein IKZ39_08455, partial [Lachnospiraceae bacterium]|nr:hypothetical protein [Lachnospiraceae bacterium]
VTAPTLAGAEELPYVITKYLCDTADAQYNPPSENKFPRARLKKLIYWDCAKPLEQPLPTDEQIRAIRFDPLNPATPPDKERGYRIFSQEFAQQAQYDAQTRLHVYLGATNKNSENTLQGYSGFMYRQQVIIKIMTNYTLESNTEMTANSRSYDIVQAVVEAINGVVFKGMSPLLIQSISKIDDERVNLGFKIYGLVDVAGENPNPNYIS